MQFNKESSIPLTLIVNPGRDIRDGLETALEKITDHSAHSTYSRPVLDTHPGLKADKKSCFQLIVIDTVELSPQSDSHLVPLWLREDILKHIPHACVVILVPEDITKTNMIYRAFRKNKFEPEAVSRITILNDSEKFSQDIQDIWNRYNRIESSGASWWELVNPGGGD